MRAGKVTTTSPRFRQFGRSTFLFLLAVAAAPAQSTLLKDAVEDISLAPGAYRDFDLRISEPRFLRLTLDQRTGPFALAVIGPRGKLAEYATRKYARIRGAWILETPGDYRLRVMLDQGMSHAADARLTVDDLRAAQGADQTVAGAYGIFWKEQMPVIRPSDARLAALRQVSQSLESAGDSAGLANALLALAEALNLRNDSQSHSMYKQALSLFRSIGDIWGEWRSELGLAAEPGNWDPTIATRTLSRLPGPANDWRRAALLLGLSRAQSLHDGLQVGVALRYWVQTADLYRSTGDTIGLAQTLNQLAAIQVTGGLYEEAVASYSESASLFANSNSPSRSLPILGLARVYNLFLFDKQKALDIYREEEERARKESDWLLEAKMLQQMAEIYGNLAEFRESLDLLLRVEQLKKEHGQETLDFELQSEIAAARQAVGDNPGAAAMRRRLAAEFEKTMPANPAQQDWFRLSGYRVAAGDLQGAKTAAEQALRVSAGEINEGPILVRLGEIASRVGDSTAATGYIEKGYRAAMRSFTNPDVLATYPQRLAELYLRSGDNGKALASAQEARRLFEASKNVEGEGRALLLMARSQRAQGHLEEAAAEAEQALSAVESVRSQLRNRDLRSSYLAQRFGTYDLRVHLLMDLDAARPHAGFAARALEVSERGRARLLLEMLRQTNTDVGAGVSPEMLHKKTIMERQLAGRIAAESALLQRNHTPQEAVEADRQVRTVAAELHGVEADIRQVSPRYAALTQPEPLSWAAIQSRLLDPQTTLLEYWTGEESSFLWAVTTDGVQGWKLPPGPQLAARVRAYYDLLTAGSRRSQDTSEQRRKGTAGAGRELAAIASELANTLLAPAAEAIRGRRILVVRGDALELAPFAALPDPEHAGSPLAAHHELVGLPSASALALVREGAGTREHASRFVAVLADPVFDRADPRLALPRSAIRVPKELPHDLARTVEFLGVHGPNGALPRLPASRAEARAIVEAAPSHSVRQFLDFDASREAAISPELSNYQILHFASHALMNTQTPELSGIVLSLLDRNGNPRNGFLTLQDIYNLNLRADLVVLSACQTGLGKEIRGEGLIGLTRAFLYAGATRVVSSRWKVDDAATARLMEYFYRAMLRSGLSPSAALRQAQIEISRQPLWASPYYWAGFELQGEWR